MTVTQPTLSATFSAPSYLFTDCPVASSRRVSVVVPVRNEADGIVQTLDALRNQRTLCGNPLHPDLYEVLVLTNNCTDNSWAQVRRYQQQHPEFALCVANITLPPEQAHIGTVRRLLMDEAFRRLQEGGHPQGIIASTDGDTLVDRHWISQILREIDAGTDAVGGRILTSPTPGPARLPHLRDALYRHLLTRIESEIDPCLHDPWPRHFQHFGASLAVTCDAYLRAGRLPVVRYLEDDALVRALHRVDARVRRSTAVRVYTSARMQGRVEVGLSWQLQQWANQQQTGGGHLVENPAVSIRRFQLRHGLRRAWEARTQPDLPARLASLTQQLSVPVEYLLDQINTCLYFGQLWEHIEARFSQDVSDNVPIRDAISWLRTRLAKN